MYLRKTYNKGFSLIELIIVIAIMAILVAIIAPNLTKYLAKSKRAADKKNADEITTSLHSAIMDYEVDYERELIPTGGSQISVTWNNSGRYVSGNTDFDNIVNSIITSSTKSREVPGHMASATIDLVDSTNHEKGYKVVVTVGNATATK